MKLSFLLLGLLLTNLVIGQTWVLETELTLKDSTYHWTSDEWGQLYQWKDNTVWLQQNQNPIPFQETYKILAEISEVQAISGLRALIYSEGQQMMGIVDNTLQLKEGLLAFFDFNFSSISEIAISNRPDFIWLFDQYRERLILFNINTAQSVQLVDNCFGGNNDAQIVQFFEYQQNLICLLKDGRFYAFDRNLTLKRKQQLEINTRLYGFENQLWELRSHSLQQLDSTSVSSHIELPDQSYQQLQILQDRFYFQQGAKIKVFRLIL
jgi:hypothetical protein